MTFTIQVEEIACIETYKVFNPNLDFIKEKEVEVVVDRCRLIKSPIPQKMKTERNSLNHFGDMITSI